MLLLLKVAKVFLPMGSAWDFCRANSTMSLTHLLDRRWLGDTSWSLGVLGVLGLCEGFSCLLGEVLFEFG